MRTFPFAKLSQQLHGGKVKIKPPQRSISVRLPLRRTDTSGIKKRTVVPKYGRKRFLLTFKIYDDFEDTRTQEFLAKVHTEINFIL